MTIERAKTLTCLGSSSWGGSEFVVEKAWSNQGNKEGERGPLRIKVFKCISRWLVGCCWKAISENYHPNWIEWRKQAKAESSHRRINYLSFFGRDSRHSIRLYRWPPVCSHDFNVSMFLPTEMKWKSSKIVENYFINSALLSFRWYYYATYFLNDHNDYNDNDDDGKTNTIDLWHEIFLIFISIWTISFAAKSNIM